LIQLNGKKESWRVSGVWSRKFYEANDLEKTEPKLLVRLNGTDPE
jgi:hypothetical protein